MERSLSVETADSRTEVCKRQESIEEGGNSTPRSGIDWRIIALHAAVVGGFLVIAIIMWWRVWIGGSPTKTITCQCGDVSEALGYLAWPPWALAHGHNPFFSNAIYAGQGGVNMLINASWIAFGIVFAPLTWLFGPVATFNVVVTLAPVVSGWCFFLAVRKFTRFVPGQIVAAALYGFSPIIVTSDPVGHFFQIWLIYPPLALLCLYDLFVTERHRPVLLGLGLGLLTVVQFFTSTEVLAISALLGVIGMAVSAIVASRPAWDRRRHILLGLIPAAGIAVLCLAYPAWFALYGPRHIVGAAWPNTPASGVAISDLVFAGAYTHQPSALLEFGGYFGPAGPNPTFVGVAVMAFLAVSAIVWFKSRLAWVFVAIGISSWLFSLGTADAWTPWRVFEHAPLISQIIPKRFGAITVFAVALLLALSADGWWSLAVRRYRRREQQLRAPHTGRSLRIAGAFLSIITAATLIPVAATYSFPYLITKDPIPHWFLKLAPHLPLGTVVLAYPYPGGIVSQAMGWQAVDGLQFRIVGGFAIVPGGDGQHSAAVSPVGGAIGILTALSLNVNVQPLPSATPSDVRLVRSSLRHWGVQVVAVTNQGRNPVYAAGYLTAVLGRPPRLQRGTLVWYGLGNRSPLRIDPAAVSRCASGAVFGLSVPNCVLSAAHRNAGSLQAEPLPSY